VSYSTHFPSCFTDGSGQANVLITNGGEACLADFGLSILLDDFSYELEFCTTPTTESTCRWMAPELIDPKQSFVGKACTSDIYAFGCVCLEVSRDLCFDTIFPTTIQLYTGGPPFYGLPEIAAIMKVMNGERPDRPSAEPFMSDALWACVNECWTQDPAMRPTAEAVMQRMEQLLE
jgi:serine/threonine protein kinase